MWFQLRTSGAWHYLPNKGLSPLCGRFEFDASKVMTVPYGGMERCKDCDRKRSKLELSRVKDQGQKLAS